MMHPAEEIRKIYSSIPRTQIKKPSCLKSDKPKPILERKNSTKIFVTTNDPKNVFSIIIGPKKNLLFLPINFNFLKILIVMEKY